MKDVLDEVGVEVTPANKKEIDAILHGIAGVEYKNCSPAWKRIKEMVRGNPDDRDRFIEKLRDAVEK
jgi:hypothetical protein